MTKLENIVIIKLTTVEYGEEKVPDEGARKLGQQMEKCGSWEVEEVSPMQR